MRWELGLMLLLCPLLMPAAALNGVVTKPVANMYDKATEDSEVVSQAIYGARLQLLEEKGDWARIESADEYTGWMPASSFRKLKEGEAAYATSGRVARVEAMFANVYRQPDVTTFAPVIVLPFETRLEVIAEPKEYGARWLQVRLIDGRTAWVQRGDITFDEKPLTMDAAIQMSKRFLGLPYLWGGTSSYGYDCSGFMQMVYRRMGVILPRDAGPQAEWKGVVAVDLKNLKPGDLLYFGSSEKKITHTGMYIGGGEFINATTYEHPTIRIDKLDEPHWSKILVAARRLK